MKKTLLLLMGVVLLIPSAYSVAAEKVQREDFSGWTGALLYQVGRAIGRQRYDKIAGILKKFKQRAAESKLFKAGAILTAIAIITAPFAIYRWKNRGGGGTSGAGAGTPLRVSPPVPPTPPRAAAPRAHPGAGAGAGAGAGVPGPMAQPEEAERAAVIEALLGHPGAGAGAGADVLGPFMAQLAEAQFEADIEAAMAASLGHPGAGAGAGAPRYVPPRAAAPWVVHPGAGAGAVEEENDPEFLAQLAVAAAASRAEAERKAAERATVLEEKAATDAFKAAVNRARASKSAPNEPDKGCCICFEEGVEGLGTIPCPSDPTHKQQICYQCLYNTARTSEKCPMCSEQLPEDVLKEAQ